MKQTIAQPPASQEEYEARIKQLCYPKKEDFLRDLLLFHSVLWDAFLDAQVRTNETVKAAHNRRATKWFYPESMRFHAHNFLSQKGVGARLVNEKDKGQEGEEPVWEPRVLAGNGIAGNINGYEYRVLKVFHGGLPPAVSKIRKDLYSQEHLKAYQAPLFPEYVDQSGFRLKPNVIYLWDIINRKLGLYYAIPTHYVTFDSTDIIPIPNPIETIEPMREETAQTITPPNKPRIIIASVFGKSKEVDPDDTDIR